MKRVNWHIPEAAGINVVQCVFDTGWTQVSGHDGYIHDDPKTTDCATTASTVAATAAAAQHVAL